MKKKALKSKSKKTRFLAVGIVILLIAAIAFIWAGVADSTQAELPILAEVSFQGEYKIGDDDWRPIIEGEHISATKGDITLRGHFQTHVPDTGEPVGQLLPGDSVSLYFNHIGGYILLPSGEKLILDPENELFGDDACATMWIEYTIVGEDNESPAETVIVLHNPHRYGNENAVDEFLDNLSIAPSGVLLEQVMLQKGTTERTIGMIIVVTALIILGIATFSTIIHIKYSKHMWLIGLMSLFAGGYFIFDAFAVSLWNRSYIINTRALGICMMLYVLFVSSIITNLLKDKLKRVALTAVSISGATILLCILIPLLSNIKFYDTWAFWIISEIPIALTLIICLIIHFKRSDPIQKLMCSMSIIALLPLFVDAIATRIGWWSGGLVSKHVFLVIFMMAIVIIIRVIPYHINAAIKARALESEQQALKLELQESRISIMLSQMQPHFIFNTLNTIYHLCEINPDVARSTIHTFSEYLRNNIDNLGQSDIIPFEKELSFVKTYLDIEKIRFDDELEISFDIKVSNFKLPVLTVQPIVENAVKHGTSKKEGVSQLFVSTDETDSHYRIVITDTGVGFDPNNSLSDEHRHVGISNVRQRLENMCGGTLSIDSTPGAGTTAVIEIPKEAVCIHENNSGR